MFKELKLVHHKLFLQKLDEEEILPNLFYKASITPIPKSDEENPRTLQTNMSYEYTHKKNQQNISNMNSTTY